MGYPAPPWQMQGQLWLSLFRVRGVEGRRDGVYGAAFVSYEPGSELTYSEVLVARPASRPRPPGGDHRHLGRLPRVGGGRPRALGHPQGPVRVHARHRPERAARAGRVVGLDHRSPVARAQFSDASRFAPRLPFRGGTWQPALDGDGEPKTATLHGSARTLPCRGGWDFAGDGPLGWLADAPPADRRRSGCPTSRVELRLTPGRRLLLLAALGRSHGSRRPRWRSHPSPRRRP